MASLITKTLVMFPSIGIVPLPHDLSHMYYIFHYTMAVDINKDHPNENKHMLFYQSLLKQRSQPTSFAFGRDSKAKYYQ